ncbi:MAG TPA: TrbI/VirB10 family protein, partial [Planctomycetaceae bacterium]|nr:TrbI/VirB10 family protein [Planctomycetaceae bacterium]
DRVVAGVVLSSALAGSLAAAGGDRNQFEESPGQAALAGIATNVNETGQDITKKNLEVQPTLVVRPGMKVAAFVREDLVLKPYKE